MPYCATDRQDNRRVLRPLRNLHPDPAHPDRRHQLRPVLQEPPLEERGGSQEEGKDQADRGGEEDGPEVLLDSGLGFFLLLQFISIYFTQAMVNAAGVTSVQDKS